jgi:hypothetical protein
LYKPEGNIKELRLTLMMPTYLTDSKESVRTWDYLLSRDLGFNQIELDKITSILCNLGCEPEVGDDDYLDDVDYYLYNDIEDLDDDDLGDLDDVDIED